MAKSNRSRRLLCAALCLISACGFSGRGHDDPATTPTVLSSTPINGAIDVPLDGSVSATFSEAMDPATLTTSTFTLTTGVPPVAVPGMVIYANSTAVFWPAADLASDGVFTATISTEANSGSGVALAAQYAWSFTGDGVAVGGPAVTLGTAANYVVLARDAISGTTATVTGNLGVSPAAATLITGFSLALDVSTLFSTSAQITGRAYAADYGSPTPCRMVTAISDMDLAYAEAAARQPNTLELNAGDIGGMTLAPGVYRWASAVTVPTSVTLDGNASAVWIFQIAGALTTTASTNIVLTGGALAKNVFWKVSGAVTLGASSHLEGVVLAATSVTLGAGTTVKGRLLAHSAVTIDGSTVVEPAP